MDLQTLDAPAAPVWDELATRVDAPPFLRPGWFEAWWRWFGRGRLRIVTGRRDGRLAGVAPLVRRWGTTLAAANGHSPEFGRPLAPLVRRARPAADRGRGPGVALDGRRRAWSAEPET